MIMKLTYSPERARLWNLVSATAFLFALILNGLANLIPLNGLETGQISDQYENYFAPTGLTFSIWAVIYLGLAFYVAWRLKHYRKINDTPADQHLMKMDIAFALSSLANGLWILAWHYLQFGLSLVLMVVLLVTLIWMNLQFKGDTSLPTLPFRIYFGWITVATVANATTLIVANFSAFQWLWNGGEVSEQIMTIIIVVITILIGNGVTLKQNDLFYGAVVVWSLLGIYLRHVINLPDFGITGVANTALIGIFITLLSILYTQKKHFLSFFRKS
jgi:hypothetical protein